LAVDAVDENRRRLVADPPTNDVSRPFCSDCWNRMRNTRSAMAAMSSPNRTLARCISFNARNIAREDTAPAAPRMIFRSVPNNGPAPGAMIAA
jgi:hypothetical protein